MNQPSKASPLTVFKSTDLLIPPPSQCEFLPYFPTTIGSDKGTERGVLATDAFLQHETKHLSDSQPMQDQSLLVPI